MAGEPASTSSSASPTPAEAAPSSASMGTVGVFAPTTPEPAPAQSGPPQVAASVVSLVGSHLKSAFPKTTFGVFSRHADVIHIAWEGSPQTEEVRSYLQTLRSQRQIPNVDLNFHDIDSEEPSPSSASGGKDHIGEYIASVEAFHEKFGEYLTNVEALLKKFSVDGALILEGIRRTPHANDVGEEEAVLERSFTEFKGLVDATLEKCGLLKRAEVPLTEESFAELRRIMNDQVIPNWTLVHKECIKFVNIRVGAIKDEAMQVLRQLDYPATEAKKAVDAAWEKYGPLETAADVVRKVLEKRSPRP